MRKLLPSIIGLCLGMCLLSQFTIRRRPNSQFMFGVLSIATCVFCACIIPKEKVIAAEVPEVEPISILDLWSAFRIDYYWIQKEENAWMHQYDTFIDTLSFPQDPHATVQLDQLKKIEKKLQDNKTYVIQLKTTSPRDASIGISFSIQKKGGLKVEWIHEYSRAKRFLKEGDIIEEIDGKVTNELSQEAAQQLLWGERGSQVTLKIARNKKSKLITLKRDIELEAGISVQYDGEICIFTVTDFFDLTYQGIQKNLDNIAKKNPKAIILDFQNNAGGALQSGAKFIGGFIGSGKLLSHTKTNREIIEYLSEGSMRIDSSIPLIVVVNKNSAALTTIIIDSLKKYRLTTIVGEIPKTVDESSVISTLISIDRNTSIAMRYGELVLRGKDEESMTIQPDVLLSGTSKDRLLQAKKIAATMIGQKAPKKTSR